MELKNAIVRAYKLCIDKEAYNICRENAFRKIIPMFRRRTLKKYKT